MNIVIVSSKEWHHHFVHEIENRTGAKVIYLKEQNEINAERFVELAPDWVFFPHWSYIIPREIYGKFRCVIFHMTDLPFGRGGSPLQNLIVRGIYETKLSALRCDEELDGGDIYIKRSLSLYGTAEEIFLRAAGLIKEMIIEIACGNIEPSPQEGEISVFKRRTPKEGDIGNLNSLIQVFDYIRMLDAEGYPSAFLDTKNLRLEFSRASLRDGYIKADVIVRVKEDEKDAK